MVTKKLTDRYKFWLVLTAIWGAGSLAAAGALLCAILDTQNGIPGTFAASIVLLLLAIVALAGGILVIKRRFQDSRSNLELGWILALIAGFILGSIVIETLI